MYPPPRPATTTRTILLIVGGIVVAMIALASAMAGAGGDGSSDTSGEPVCRTEFFDSGSISTCDGELLYTDDNGNDLSSGG